MNARFSFQTRLWAGCVLVVLITLLLVAMVSQRQQEGRITENARLSLEPRLNLALDLVRGRWSAQLDLAQSEKVALEVGRLAGLRLTLIAPDGRVLGDSDLELKEVEALENHAQRPEVVQALALGRGDSIRYSSTLGHDLLYAAAILGSPGDPQLVARLALPLATVQEAVAASRRLLLMALALGVLLSLGVAWLVARGINRPLRELTATARAIAGGDLSRRVRRYPPHEVGQLGRAFDEMADHLEQRLDEVCQAASRQQAILLGMMEGVMLCDQHGRVLLVNQALVDLVGLSGDPVGRLYSEAIRIPDLQEAMRQAYASPSLVSRQVRSLTPKPRHLEVHLLQVAGDKTPSGVVAVFHDISERLRTEQMRRDFVANTSHELRTPLAAIKGAAETLLGGALDSPADARNFVEMIERQAKRLERLGEDLLTLAQLENREGAPRREPLDLADMLDSVLATVEQLAAQKNQALVRPQTWPELELLGDRRQLEQALVNLLDNAIKYSDAGGQVSLAAQLRAGLLCLEVADTGPGIPREHLPRIFERFYRVDKNRSRSQGGTGLGLAIVKHIAQSHGGSVEVESVLGQGSRFRLLLPLNPPEPRPAD